MRAGLLFALFVSAAFPAYAPSPAQRGPDQKPLAFEVASIKPSEGARRAGPVSPDRFVRSNATLFSLVVYAYDVAGFQIEGGDAWTRTVRFDVEAKADGLPTRDQQRTMVRHLLEERFSLKAHSETRALPRYTLVTARSDGRLPDNVRPAASGRDCGVLIGGRWLVRGCTLAEFAKRLQPLAQRIIIDKTGVTGRYDFEMEVQMDVPQGLLPPQLQSSSDGVSLFTALQEQLGLKLESTKGPVDVLVIDHVERPTPD